MELNFEIQSTTNPTTGLTEKIIFKGMTLDSGYNSKSFITIHYVTETISNGIVISTKNGGYRLDEGSISVDKNGTILPQLDENKEPMLDEEGNIIPRTDACTKFITMLYNGFFNTVKDGIIEFEG